MVMRNLLRTLCATLGLIGMNGAHAEVQVFACEPEWQALTEAIGGDRVDTWSATTAADDPHHVQARPSLIARARRADLLVCTGAELETGWLPLLLRNARNPRIQPGQPGYLMAAEQVVRLEIPTRLDRSDGDIHAMGNPHIQLDPRRVLTVAQAIASRLSAIDPDDAKGYQRRLGQFEQQWRDAMRDWQARAAPLRGRQVVVQHTEWIYMLDWLGMHRAAALEPKPGIPPSAAHLAELKRTLVPSEIMAIVRAPASDPRPAEWLSGQTGIPVVVLPQTVEADAGPGALFSLFDTLVDRLLEAAR